MDIQWRDVLGFEEYFKVSNTGAVLSKRTGKILKQAVSHSGYMVLSTRIGGRKGKCYCLRVHRLVAEAFLPPPDIALVAECSLQGHGQVLARHLDDDKSNNWYLNLAWGTSQDNSDDFKNSPSFSAAMAKNAGSKNVFAKADDGIVQAIRARYKKGSRIDGARALAIEYGMHHTNIARLAASRSYR